MKIIFNESDSRELDRQTIESGFRSGENLMHNAGLSVARAIMEEIPRVFAKKVAVFAGKGNNGGDGIVIHHFLREFSIDSTLFVLNEKENSRDLFERYDIDLESVKVFGGQNFEQFDVAVDAIFGIGLQREVGGVYAEMIAAINSIPQVVAVDLPSGIRTDDGAMLGSAVQADMCVTMGAAKFGHFLGEGKSASGRLIVAEIGFQDFQEGSARFVDAHSVRKILPTISPDAHKYSRGLIGVLGGSRGMNGAALLAAKGAYGSGAGMVKLFLPASENGHFQSQFSDALTVPLPDDGRGFLSQTNLPDILKFGDNIACWVLGPGLSLENASLTLLKNLLSKLKSPLVFDAGALELIAQKKIAIHDLPEGSILSPHLGEFIRMFALDKQEFKANPVQTLRSLADQTAGRVLILKGPTTFILQSNGQISLMAHGNASLAVAGSGDVLSGMLAALLAQGVAPDLAAQIACFLHAEAGLQTADRLENDFYLASDLAASVGPAFRQIRDGNTSEDFQEIDYIRESALQK